MGATGLEDLRDVMHITDTITDYKKIIEQILAMKKINEKGLDEIKKYSFAHQGKIASKIVSKINQSKHTSNR